MKHHRFFRVFTVLAVASLSFFAFASSARAIGTATVGTTLTFQAPTPVSVGSPAIVVLQMISSKGAPYMNAEPERTPTGMSPSGCGATRLERMRLSPDSRGQKPPL
jgi:hypothetical protein